MRRPQGDAGEGRGAEREAAWLRGAGASTQWWEMARGPGDWPLRRALCPPAAQAPMVRGWARAGAGGGLQSTPVRESWHPLGPGLRALLLGQPHRFLLPASWKTGPWTPCSASCGGGSQSRSVYCVWSDGAGGEEAMEEVQCAGLPGKPATTQACNLQRCAAWREEPWGEVRWARQGWAEVRSWVLGPGQGWEVCSLPWK